MAALLFSLQSIRTPSPNRNIQGVCKIFDVFPCAILKNEEQLFYEERDAYPDPTGVDPLLLGFSFMNRSKGTNLSNLLKAVFREPSSRQREKEWPELKVSLLKDWLDLKKNYPPKGRRYQLPEAAEFARKATFQHVAFRDAAWLRELTSKREPFRWTAFPSVAMTLLTVFFRLYEPQGRKAVPQDVFDVLISTPTPYLDVVITENMQAEIIRKAKRVLAPIRNVEVYTLRDIRDVNVA